MTKKQLQKENEELKKQIETIRMNNEVEISKVVRDTPLIIDGDKLIDKLIDISRKSKGNFLPVSLFISRLIEWLPNAEIKNDEMVGDKNEG